MKDLRDGLKAWSERLPIIFFLLFGIGLTILTPYAIRNATIDQYNRLSQTLQRRLAFDVREFNWYREEGTWFEAGLLPYRDLPYEYPVLATALFTLPALIAPDSFSYHVVFRVLVVIMGVVLMVVTGSELRRQGRLGLLWIFLLPSVLYFTVNRFDVFPALALQISLLSLFRERWKPAYIWLAVSILFKWYAGFLLPLYMLFMFDSARLPAARRRGFYGLVGCVALLLAGHLWVLVVGGSLLDAINPYAIHFVRSPEIGSLTAAVLAPFGYRFITSYSLENIAPGFVAAMAIGVFGLLQFSGLAFIVWRWLRARYGGEGQDALTIIVRAAFIIIGCFVLFNRVYSFQWVVWLAPLFVLIRPNRKEIAAFILFDVVNYVQFPVLYGTFIDPKLFSVFSVLTVVRSLLLGFLIAQSAMYFFHQEGEDRKRGSLFSRAYETQ